MPYEVLQLYREGVRCRRCYLHQLEVERQEEQEVIQEVYLGESSRSVVSRSREHFRRYMLATGKTARSRTITRMTNFTTAIITKEESKEDNDKGSCWMANHAISHHGGTMSADPTQHYAFFIIGSWPKPL